MMEDLSIRLIVKAPNQQIEDQTVHCQPTWTIGQLKGHLAEVYPCKPKKEEQKLIYSGRFLTDSVVLKDVLRHYEGQNTHTVHLVCSIPQKRSKRPDTSRSNTTNMTVTANRRDNSNQAIEAESGVQNNRDDTNSSNELRRRNNVAETNVNPSDSINAHISYWQSQFNNTSQNNTDPWRSNVINPWTAYRYNPAPMMAGPQTFPVGGDPMAIAAAQMAWMQQMQVQYMQFYTQMMQTGGAGGMVGFQNFLMNQQVQQNNTEQLNAANQDPQAANVQGNALLNQNNGQPGNELENWDWLEYFFLISRLGIMFVIIYFYSSPARFLLVLVTGFFIYLYQIRYFHALFQNNEPENNNNEPGNNNNNAAADNQQQRGQAGDNNNAENAQENNRENAAETQENQNEENNVTQANNNQPSRLAITWTIITSFLTSLLPDAPNAM